MKAVKRVELQPTYRALLAVGAGVFVVALALPTVTIAKGRTDFLQAGWNRLLH